VVIPNEASTADAIDALNRAMREQPGVLTDPPPRALVEALEPGGVRIRAYFWSPTQNIDWFQLTSDVKLRAKVALQQAGVIPPPAVAAPAKLEGPSAPTDGTPPSPADTAALQQAAANLRRDAKAADSAASAAVNGQQSPMESVLDQHETRVSDEGTNLLKGTRPE
jgi:hypothetical protein